MCLRDSSEITNYPPYLCIHMLFRILLLVGVVGAPYFSIRLGCVMKVFNSFGPGKSSNISLWCLWIEEKRETSEGPVFCYITLTLAKVTTRQKSTESHFGGIHS